MARALSKAKRAHNLSKQREIAYCEAVAAYQAEHRAYEASTDLKRRRPRSLRDIVAGYGSLITVTTLSRRVKGLPSASDIGHKRTKLKPEEESCLVDELRVQAGHGFPMTHRIVKEVATDILRRRHEREGTKFQPIGRTWSAKFMLRHSDVIKTYWSTPLHSVRAGCVNTHTLDGWFDLLGHVLHGDFSEGEMILPENIANFDETGWVPATRVTHRVIGPVGQKLQYEVQSGMRENITIMCTVTADGRALRPIVIFKGVNLQSRWGASDKTHNVADA